MPIHGYLTPGAAFDPDEIEVLSEAFKEACRALRIDGDVRGRDIVAERIIALCRAGPIDAKVLSERVIREFSTSDRG
ncbi:hypothetical protein LB518_11630 [Mesorhizobium sp. BR1-1-16]|uniref:hypothetical protein n=1 Tax=Mesorhizobium sp. BR1-1-16 TaxID=2876653 RepID=UPI001CCA94A3|nr:hypothetical protein [Mesorhizobium sp. BR1-1-16]MBZ9936947.1 hypothetical protein [Mesorhizobium sp. BR1-1-16]